MKKRETKPALSAKSSRAIVGRSTAPAAPIDAIDHTPSPEREFNQRYGTIKIGDDTYRISFLKRNNAVQGVDILVQYERFTTTSQQTFNLNFYNTTLENALLDLKRILDPLVVRS